jgi:hypothetical protein
MTRPGVPFWTRAAPAPTPAHPLLDRLWARYVEEVPPAALFARLSGGRFENDHIALRSLWRPGDPSSGIAVFEPVFEGLGWRRAATYEFPDVHLRAIHMSRAGFPRIFISELDVGALPVDVRNILLAMPRDSRAPHADVRALAAWFAPPTLMPTSADLDVVMKASQYGAWLLCFGRKVNHFTGSVADVDNWQKKLTAAGVSMKSTIEGEAGGPLRQTATQASTLDVKLADGVVRSMPYAYFEIAERRGGFDGFLAPQARQLFDMTQTAPASSSSPQNQRRHPRKSALLHVELGYGGVRVPVESENVSLGGLFLAMPDDIAPDAHTVLEMALELPSGHVHATGTVVYRIEGRGVGVEFTWWDDEEAPARQQLARFLDSLA